MSWLGIGLIGPVGSPVSLSWLESSIIDQIQPSARWNGTAASGFTTAPVDPVRTTSKPALRLIVPPNQHFTDMLEVGVMAAANDGGTLFINLGIASVTFHCEGNSVSVGAPRWHTIQTQRGPRTYFGWWVRLKKPADRAGKAHLYIEATARDATMQHRVIGPYFFSPVSQLYDFKLTVAPSQPVIAGQRYQSIAAASSYAKNNGAHNFLITVTEPGRYDTGPDDTTAAWDRTGYCCITASVPGVYIGKNGYTTDTAAVIRPNSLKLRLMGPNITLDRKDALWLHGVPDMGHWLDGCNFGSTSPEGKAELFRGVTRNANRFVYGRPWFTEVQATQTENTFTEGSLCRGCYADDIGQDLASGTFCVVQSQFYNHDNDHWNTDIPAFTVQYTGSESTAILARTGGTGGFLGGVYRCTIGSTLYTFDVGNGTEGYYNGSVGDGYWFEDVVEWLNTLPDVTATFLIEPDRIAATGSLPGLRGQGFDGAPNRAQPISIKTASPVTIYSHTDKHGDFYQIEGGTAENTIVAFNKVVGASVQFVFLAPIADGASLDQLFFGNIFRGRATGDTSPADDVGASSMGRANVECEHVVLVHNNFMDQRLVVTTTAVGLEIDDYCLGANNVAPSFSYQGGVLTNDLDIRNMRIYEGGGRPSVSENTRIGGTEETLFVDANTGDFTPAGLMLTEGFAPMIPFDMDRTPFPAIAAVGAIAAEASAYVPPPPSANPLVDLLALLNAAGWQSAVHDCSTATISGSIWTSQDMTSLNNDHFVTTSNNHPEITPQGGLFSAADVLVQTIDGGLLTVIMSFTKTNASTNGGMISDNTGAGRISYTQGSTNPLLAASSSVGDTFCGTAGALYNALHQAGKQVVTFEGMNFASRNQLRIARGSGSMLGTVGKIVIIDSTKIVGDSFENAKSLARAWAAS